MSKDRKQGARNAIDRLWRAAVPSTKQDGPPEDALIIGEDPETKLPAYFNPPDLSLHLHVAGGWGAGKSNFLRVLLGQLLKRKRLTGEGFALIDPHGNLATYARDLIASKYPEFADELHYMDLAQKDKVLGFNPLRRGSDSPYFVAACVTEALVKAYGAQGTHEKPLIARVLSNLTEALIHTGSQLTDAHYFLQRSNQDQAVLRNLLNQIPAESDSRAVRSFWEEFDAKPAATADAYALGPLNRLDPLIKPRAFKRMLAVPEVTLDFKELMDEGGIALFNLAREGAGVTPDAQHMFAALLVQEFRQVFEERTPEHSRAFTLIMDEFGDYVPADFARVLTAARKFGLQCVFAHQHLSQLVDKDQDRTLLEAILAVPNKAIFGDIPLNDAKVLAEEMFLGVIDPDKIKHWVETVTWDPIPTRVTVRSRSKGYTEGESDTQGESSSRSSSTTAGGTFDPETERELQSSSTSESEAESSSRQRTFSTQYSWTKGEQEAWTTFYQKRIQKGTPVYRTPEEQIFLYAKQLKMSPRGQGVMVRYGEAPQTFLAPHRPDIGFSEEDLAAFLEELYKKPIYLDAGELDQLIEEREQKLLAAAEPRIKSSSGGKERLRASRKRKNDR